MVDVFTFHGLAGKLFDTVIYNDSTLRSWRMKKLVPTWTGKPYEIVILDELQDCTDDLFWLICAFVSAVTNAASCRAPQIVALGDERQGIYAFRGADSRYLSLASSTMTTLSPYPWTRMALSKSFRLSHENSAFVNNVFLGGEQYIVGSHSGPKPVYCYGNMFALASITQTLLPLIRQYRPEQVAILAPSVRSNEPLSRLTNHLSEVYGIPIAVSISDDVPLDDQVLQGKICVSTYHQFKGNERDLVIVYGIDASYFKFQARDLPDDTCPNTTFVALTRARKQLVLIHHNENQPMPFVNVAELNELALVVSLDDNGEMQQPPPPGRPLQLGLLLPTSVSASNMARHVPDEIIDDICATHLQVIRSSPSLPRALHIDAPDIVLTDHDKKHHEAVSDLNGLAVVAAYEHALLDTLTTLQKSKTYARNLRSDKAQAIELCREACKYEARVSGYKSRSIQMRNHPFDWLTPYLDAARARLQAEFPQTASLEFEVELKEKNFRVESPSEGEAQSTDVYGRADIIRYEGKSSAFESTTGKKRKSQAANTISSEEVSIWEIKFVAQLSLEHVIQACVYAYLWSNQHGREKPPGIVLFNVRDGEKWEIAPRDGIASLRAVVEATLVAKYSTRDTLTTDEFLQKCARTKAEVEKQYAKSRRDSHTGGM
jgi:hypothetical protein